MNRPISPADPLESSIDHKRLVRTATHQSATAPGSPAAGGDAAMADLVEWFRGHREQLPREPFQLSPGVRVADPPLFYATLDREVAAGPGGARWHCGALAIDLARLRELLAAADNKPQQQRPDLDQ